MTTRLTRRAIRQAQALFEHYRERERPEAIDHLADAIQAAQIAIPPIEKHRPAPRPYPEIASPGTGWIKEGRYWFAYGIRRPRMIRAVYYDAADIPRRV